MENSQKKRLKELAHSLEPLIRVGKRSVPEGVIENIDLALRDHELIKVKFLGHKEEKRELIMKVVEKTHCELIDLIGNTAILYRESPEPKKRKVKLNGKVELKTR